MHSYKIPGFIERLLVNPRKLFESIEWCLQDDSLAELCNDDQHNENDYLRNLLFKIVISGFVCLENKQYFTRMAARDDVINIFRDYEKKFEELSIKVGV